MTNESTKLLYCMDSPNCKVYNSFVKLLGDGSSNKEVLINGVIIEHDQLSKSSSKYSCIALERLFNYPSVDISDFGTYDFGKDKIKKYQELFLIDKGKNYEFNCEKIDKLNRGFK